MSPGNPQSPNRDNSPHIPHAAMHLDHLEAQWRLVIERDSTGRKSSSNRNCSVRYLTLADFWDSCESNLESPSSFWKATSADIGSLNR